MRRAANQVVHVTETNPTSMYRSPRVTGLTLWVALGVGIGWMLDYGEVAFCFGVELLKRYWHRKAREKAASRVRRFAALHHLGRIH